MKPGREGFSLIEVLIASIIVSIVVAGLTLSLQVGLKAHAQSEKFLAETRDGEMLALQLTSELRSAVPLSTASPEGTESRLRFPARLAHYSKQGMREGIYAVEYEFTDGRLVRSERPLKRESLKQRAPSEEVLLADLKQSKFEYLFVDESGAVRWRGSWNGSDRSEMPRGIRWTLRGGAEERESVREILIPQGVLRKIAG